MSDDTLLRLYANTFGVSISQAKHDLGVWRLDPSWKAKAKEQIAERSVRTNRLGRG